MRRTARFDARSYARRFPVSRRFSRATALLLALVALFAWFKSSPAQAAAPTEAESSAQPSPSDTEPAWGVEADLLRPFVPEAHIISLQLTRRLWMRGRHLRGDLVVGAYLRPRVAHDIVETIDEYLVIAGYRQYLWHGLHLEGAVLAGWAWGDNNLINGRDYSEPAVLVEGVGGYRLDLLKGRSTPERRRLGLYITPQVGIIAGVFTNIGPRGGNSDVFLDGKLLVGLAF